MSDSDELYEENESESEENDFQYTITSGPLFRTVNTDFIQVSILNLFNIPQTMTVSIIDWQNTCNEDEFPKFGFLCGEIVNDPDDTITTQNGNGNGNGPIFSPPEAFIPVLTPFTFTIPPRQLFTVQAFLGDVFPPTPMYEVRVTFPLNVVKTDPIMVNTWGISAAGVIQAGTRMFNTEFKSFPTGDVRFMPM
ncbi:sodium:proton exchanger [Peribacillus simplex]|uniref:sodium:proton exchanger n=1 Tax=Peribacillus simplex TaxID=1478 RepID=UPI0036705F32